MDVEIESSTIFYESSKKFATTKILEGSVILSLSRYLGRIETSFYYSKKRAILVVPFTPGLILNTGHDLTDKKLFSGDNIRFLRKKKVENKVTVLPDSTFSILVLGLSYLGLRGLLDFDSLHFEQLLGSVHFWHIILCIFFDSGGHCILPLLLFLNKGKFLKIFEFSPSEYVSTGCVKTPFFANTEVSLIDLNRRRNLS